MSLRHTILPVLMSTQETMPLAPKVQILPSATAGVARVPGCELDLEHYPVLRAHVIDGRAVLPSLASLDAGGHNNTEINPVFRGMVHSSLWREELLTKGKTCD